MRGRGIVIVLTGLIALALVACSEKPAREPGSRKGTGSSSATTAAIGESLSAIVELSDMYRAPETYDVKIVVLEVLRGETATALLKRSGISNAVPPNGFDYLLARIQFDYTARGAPGDKPWEFASGQFSAFSGDGKPYAAPSIIAPEPRLDGSLRSGDSRQGWMTFAVAKEDRKPVMVFSPGSIWFRLY